MKPKARHNQSAELSQFFQAMGMSVEREWRDAGYDAGRFPQIAAAALERFNAPKQVDPISVLRNIDAAPWLHQRDVDGNFSNLPLTLFNGTRFYIDLYFWLDGTTSIHQHAFAGAFQVLTGSSLHSHYKFQLKRPVSPHFALGDLSLREVRLLARGDIRKIVPGRDYIHSLFHLDRPSTTLTVRTIGVPTAQPQFSYMRPGVALDPFLNDPAVIKRVQSADVLLAMHHPEAEAIVSRMLQHADLETTFALLSTAYGHLCDTGPEQFRGLSRKADSWSTLLQTVRARHGDAADLFAAALAESQRQSTVIHRRSSVSSAELRYFLALLLNVPDRKRILDLVKERYPDEPALETVLNWVEDLSRIKLGTSESNALGINDFDDIHLLVIESLVKGKSQSKTQRELRKIFPHEDQQQFGEKIRTRYEELSQNVLLKPLFKAS